MKRTRNITLLITSSVVLAACQKPPKNDLWGGEEKATPTPTPAVRSSGSHALGWWLWGRSYSGSSSLGYGGGSSGGSSSEGAVGSVSRGGFGSTAGHGSASS